MSSRLNILIHASPVLLVECKAPYVKLSDSVIDQVIRYNMVLKVPYIMITNGERTFLCRLDKATGRYGFINYIPKYSELTA